jgi:hypothetical protein
MVLDFPDPHELAGKHGREVDLEPADADASAAGHADGAVVVGVLRIGWRLVDAC